MAAFTSMVPVDRKLSREVSHPSSVAPRPHSPLGVVPATPDPFDPSAPAETSVASAPPRTGVPLSPRPDGEGHSHGLVGSRNRGGRAARRARRRPNRHGRRRAHDAGARLLLRGGATRG